MRVLVDHQAFCLERVGGITRYHFELARALVAEELCQVDFYAGFHRSGLARGPLGCGWRGLGLPWMPHTGYPLQVLSALALSGLPSNRWQVHHQSYVYPFAGPARAARVLTHHDCIYERWPGQFGDAARVIMARCRSLKIADAIICVSAHAREDLLSRYQLDPARVHVIHHGLTRLPAPAPEAPHARPYILHVGRRGGYKDFKTPLTAWSSSPQLAQAFDLVAFGGGPLTPEERSLAAGSVRPSGLHQVSGDDATLATWYAHAAALVVPSQAEGFGFPVLEGLAAGVPVLAARATSLPEVGGTAVILVAPGEPSDWSSALDRLLSDHDLQARLRQAGLERVREFTWQTCARKTARVYASVAL